jgi:hypothetical protein
MDDVSQIGQSTKRPAERQEGGACQNYRMSKVSDDFFSEMPPGV